MFSKKFLITYLIIYIALIFIPAMILLFFPQILPFSLVQRLYNAQPSEEIQLTDDEIQIQVENVDLGAQLSGDESDLEYTQEGDVTVITDVNDTNTVQIPGESEPELDEQTIQEEANRPSTIFGELRN